MINFLFRRRQFHQALTAKMEKETVVPAWAFALSFNAQTLLRKGERVALAKQFRDLRIAMAGIQETRSRSPSNFSLDGWVFVGSAADSGDYGVELWVDTRAVVGHRGKTKLIIVAEAITVWTRLPRLLIDLIDCDAWTAWWWDMYRLLTLKYGGTLSRVF